MEPQTVVGCFHLHMILGNVLCFALYRPIPTLVPQILGNSAQAEDLAVSEHYVLKFSPLRSVLIGKRQPLLLLRLCDNPKSKTFLGLPHFTSSL